MKKRRNITFIEVPCAAALTAAVAFAAFFSWKTALGDSEANVIVGLGLLFGLVAIAGVAIDMCKPGDVLQHHHIDHNLRQLLRL